MSVMAIRGTDDEREGSSMYGQLLAAVVDDESEDGGSSMSEQDLVRQLAHCRVRLAPSWSLAQGALGVDAASSLAAQLQYDATLLRLCRLRGIASSPERFSRPDAERHRLERALAAAGIAVP
jgi:hypothetical protein